MRKYLLELYDFGELEIGDVIAQNIKSGNLLIVEKKLSKNKYNVTATNSTNATSIFTEGTVCKNIYGISGVTSLGYVVIKSLKELKEHSKKASTDITNKQFLLDKIKEQQPVGTFNRCKDSIVYYDFTLKVNEDTRLGFELELYLYENETKHDIDKHIDISSLMSSRATNFYVELSDNGVVSFTRV